MSRKSNRPNGTWPKRTASSASRSAARSWCSAPVTNEEFIAKAIELKADALLVSQTVTQKDIHIKNLTELVEMLEAEGLRDKVILACGGPRISHELAKELGYDAGFGMNTYADDVASFIAQEMARRMHRK